MKEKGHVIKVLELAKKAALSEDVVELKNLSNQTVHSASIYREEDNVLVAVIVYALSKIIEKGERYYKENYNRYLNHYLKSIDKIVISLKNNDDVEFRKQVRLITSSKEISTDLKYHLQGLFRKARINKAGKVYEHGISMEKTAKLLGISLWELAEYSGQGPVSDEKQGKTFDIRKRIKLAMELFK